MGQSTLAVFWLSLVCMRLIALYGRLTVVHNVFIVTWTEMGRFLQPSLFIQEQSTITLYLTEIGINYKECETGKPLRHSFNGINT